MARTELGTKRVCATCAVKFYDLRRDPIICPKCNTPFKLPKAEAAKASRVTSRAPVKATKEDNDDSQLVSLDAMADDEAIADLTDDVDVADAEDGTDDTFLEDDEDDNDVTSYIGDVKTDEEE